MSDISLDQRSKLSRMTQAWLIYRSLTRYPRIILAAGFVYVPMFLLSTGSIWDRQAPGPSMAFFLVFFIYISVAIATFRLRFLDPLPISRRTLFRGIYLFVIGFLMIGIGSTTMIRKFSEKLFPDGLASYGLVSFDPHSQSEMLEVPLAVYRFAPVDAIPTSTAPWGEEHTPQQISLAKKFPWVLYSPYSVPPGSSQDFFFWQTSRAIEAIFGRTISAEELQEQMLAEPPSGETQEMDHFHLKSTTCCFQLDGMNSDLTPRGVPVFYPLFLLMMVLLWSGLYAIFLSRLRIGMQPGQVKNAFNVGIILIMAPTFAIPVLFFFMKGNMTLFMIWKPIVHTLQQFPGASWIAWAVTAACLIFLDRLMTAHFERADLLWSEEIIR